MDRKIIEYLPEWLRKFYEIKVIMDQGQVQIEKLWDAIESIWNNNFIESLDEAGCEKWESMLEIKNKDTYTLNDRRLKITSMLAEQRPFTLKSLDKMLATICGQNEIGEEPNYTVLLDAANYKLIVRIALTSANVFEDVVKLLERVVPCNLVIDASLLYTKHGQLTEYTHSEMSVYTHKELRQEMRES